MSVIMFLTTNKSILYRLLGILNLLLSLMYGYSIFLLCFLSTYNTAMSIIMASIILTAPIGTIITGKPYWLLPNAIITISIGVFYIGITK